MGGKENHVLFSVSFPSDQINSFKSNWIEINLEGGGWEGWEGVKILLDSRGRGQHLLLAVSCFNSFQFFRLNCFNSVDNFVRGGKGRKKRGRRLEFFSHLFWHDSASCFSGGVCAEEEECGAGGGAGGGAEGGAKEEPRRQQKKKGKAGNFEMEVVKATKKSLL